MNAVCGYIMDIGGWAAEVAWADWLQGVGTMMAGFAAFFALNTWRTQLKTSKQIEFIDSFSDTMHEFLHAMAEPVTHLELAHIEMEAHAQPGMTPYEESVNFIEKRGESRATAIHPSLSNLAPIAARMGTLAVKGQVMGFDGYERLFNSSQMLMWSFNQLQAFRTTISMAHMFWSNPEVERSTMAVVSIKAGDIRRNLEIQSIEVLNFAKDVYKRAYG